MTPEEFVARLEVADGPLQLEPWQRDMVDRLLSDEPLPTLREIVASNRRAARRYAMDVAVAASIVSGHPIHIAAATPAEAEAARQRAMVIVGKVVDACDDVDAYLQCDDCGVILSIVNTPEGPCDMCGGHLSTKVDG